MDPKLLELLISKYGLSRQEAETFATGMSKANDLSPAKRAMEEMLKSSAYMATLGTTGMGAVSDNEKKTADGVIATYRGIQPVTGTRAGAAAGARGLAASEDLHDDIERIKFPYSAQSGASPEDLRAMDLGAHARAAADVLGMKSSWLADKYNKERLAALANFNPNEIQMDPQEGRMGEPFVMPPHIGGTAPFSQAASQGFATEAKKNPSRY